MATVTLRCFIALWQTRRWHRLHPILISVLPDLIRTTCFCGHFCDYINKPIWRARFMRNTALRVWAYIDGLLLHYRTVGDDMNEQINKNKHLYNIRRKGIATSIAIYYKSFVLVLIDIWVDCYQGCIRTHSCLHYKYDLDIFIPSSPPQNVTLDQI